MQHTTARTIAAAGVLVTAIAAALLIWPSARNLGDLNGLWVAAAILGLPILLLLSVSGAFCYGVTRSIVVAAVITVITLGLSLVAAVFTFATALSGTMAGVVVAVALFGLPVLSVLILGFLALRLVDGRSATPAPTEAAAQNR
jgi:hypothetical protein